MAAKKTKKKSRRPRSHSSRGREDVGVANGDDDASVDDPSDSDETIPTVAFEVTSFGADYDVEGIVKRLDRGDVQIPTFQRSFVWPPKTASRFIESLLLGLPVPGIFLAKEPETNVHLVIDGLQRLRTLQFFHNGFFDPKPNEPTKRTFQLEGVSPAFEGKAYADLSETDRRRLDNSIIHATIVQQQKPEGDDTSTYHIFARLNSGGMRLTPQEIRCALYHGQLLDLVQQLNEHRAWRDIYGPKSKRLKDQELILRFLALYFDRKRYERPMSEFLNKFCGRNRNPSPQFAETVVRVFERTIDEFEEALGSSAFHPERALNAAVFDSCMYGLACRIDRGTSPKPGALAKAYKRLLSDSAFKEATGRATADESAVDVRLTRAAMFFAGA